MFADTLYGQVVAWTLGLGDLLPRDQMLSHLKVEAERNDSPFGMIVQTGRLPEANQQDNSIWMGGSIDWTSLMLRLDQPISESLTQSAKLLGNWMERLEDRWNIWGLGGGRHTGIDGLGWITSHYSFHMPLYHTPFAYTNQIYSAPNSSLTIQSILPPPYALPILIPGALAKLSARLDANKRVSYTLRLLLGELTVKNFLVDGEVAPIIQLTGGQNMTWTRPSSTPASSARTARY